MEIRKIINNSEFSKKVIKFFYFMFKEERINTFSDKLFLNNFLIKSFSEFILLSIFIGGIFSIILMIFLFYLDIDYQKIIIFGFLIFFIPFFLIYLISDVLFERNKRKKEDLLPELLLEMSVFVDQMSLIKIIEEVSKMDFSILSEDFKLINLQLKNSQDINTAINKIKKMNNSKIISRFFDVLLQGYYSGSKLSKLLSELAEEMLSNRAIIREIGATMLVTKYTLLLASVLIVPTILGLIITLVNGFNFSFSGDFEIGLSKIQRDELFNLSVIAVQIYIIEYALISSFFLAMQDNNKKNFFIYALILSPLAAIFFFIGTIL